MPKGIPTFHDISGLTFGRLAALPRHEIRGRRRVYWLCRCTCGTEKWVIVDALKAGRTQSCGCLNDEKRRANATHGATRNAKHSSEYAVWHSMKQRCTNPKNMRYHRYGGRGIKICERWIDSFETFLADMGPRPSNTSIERIDNNGNYEPDNCCWATKAVQNRNHSRNREITFNGVTLCLADWCAKTGIPHATLSYRLKNWPIERALTEPLGPSYKQ